MQPGDTINLTVRRRTVGGQPAASLVTADFSVTATLDGAAVSVSPTVTYVDTVRNWARYDLTAVLPGTKGMFALFTDAAVGLDVVSPARFDLEIEDFDLDAIGAIIVAPIVSVVSNGGPQGDIALSLIKGDYTPLSFSVTDQSGAAINLLAWNNPQFGIKSKDQSTTTYVQTTGIAMTSGGLVTIAVPETATVYAALVTPVAAGPDQVQLYWSFTADEASDATKTRTLARGIITIKRREL